MTLQFITTNMSYFVRKEVLKKQYQKDESITLEKQLDTIYPWFIITNINL